MFIKPNLKDKFKEFEGSWVHGDFNLKLSIKQLYNHKNSFKTI